MVQRALECAHKPLQFCPWKFRGQAFSRAGKPLRGRGADGPQGRHGISAVFRQLPGQKQQDIELPYGAELSRGLSETATERPGDIVFQPQEREQFAKSPGGHARAVESLDITRFDALDVARKGVDPLPEWPVGTT